MYRNIVLKTSDLIFGYSVYKTMIFLNRSQWWSPEKLRNYQFKKLLRLISHSSETVPFYRNYFKVNNLSLSDFKCLDDIKKLPIVNKDTYRNYRSDFISESFSSDEMLKISTGGTTGSPLETFTTKHARSFLRCSNLRGRNWADILYAEKTVTLAGSSLIPNESMGYTQFLRNIFERNISLSATHINNEILKDYILKINRFKPKVIRGYPSSIFSLANFIREENLTVHKPKVIFTTAEMLLDNHRNLIEETFSCKVYNHYSNPESMANAHECPYGNLHLGTDITFVELEKKHLIATDLNNLAMPVIRYDTEDIGTIYEGKCDCGRSLPILKSLEGRATDILSFKNGNKIGGPALTLIFKDFSLLNYQLIQNTSDSLEINLIKGINFKFKDIESIEKIMQYHCGNDINIKINIVSKISVPEGKKSRFIINNSKTK